MEATNYLWYKGTFKMIRQSDFKHVFCILYTKINFAIDHKNLNRIHQGGVYGSQSVYSYES